jgi:hypothetical protein
MAISTGLHPKALWPGINQWFGIGYAEHMMEYKYCFDTETSSQAWEEDVLASGFPMAPEKPEGSPYTYATHNQGYVARYTHKPYGLGFMVTYEERKDNLYEKLANSRAKSLGFSMRQTKETVAANVFNRATNTSYTGGDGVVLLATTHPSKVGDWSNILNPAADISEASLEDLLIQIMKAENEDGHKISLMGESLKVPPDLFFEANRILKSTLQNDTANNALNVLRSTGQLPGGIHVNHYFTDTDAFFIRTNCPDGMKHYQRDRIELETDNDFDTKNSKVASYDRYVFKWSDPRGLYGSIGV